VTRKQDSAKGRIRADDLKKLLAEDRDLLKTIVEETLQQELEAKRCKQAKASAQRADWDTEPVTTTGCW
jgi:hypothetical protein